MSKSATITINASSWARVTRERDEARAWSRHWKKAAKDWRGFCSRLVFDEAIAARDEAREANKGTTQ